MKRNIVNNSNNSLISRLRAEKKKTVMAVCLIALMVFMWVRVFTKKSPKPAGASMITQVTGQNKTSKDSGLKISFTELPKVAGRNDVLTRDFFASEGLANLISDGKNRNSGNTEVSVVSKDGSEERIKQVAEKLELEAIVMSQNPQVFINDKLLGLGGKLTFTDETSKYEFQIVEIEENMVIVKCRETRIKLKLAEDVEQSD